MKSVLLVTFLTWLVLLISVKEVVAVDEFNDVKLDNSSAMRETQSLSHYLKVAFEKNPQIQSARFGWIASIEKFPQARSLPDPQLNVSWFMEPIETRNGSNDYGVQLMQMIPYPGKLQLKGRKALTMAEMAEIKFEKTVRNVLVEVMSSYYELGYLNRAIEVAAVNRDLFKQLVEQGNIENSQDKLGTSELMAAESRLAQAEYELVLLRELRNAESANMQKLVNDSIEDSIDRISLPIVEAVEIDIDSLKELAEEHSHELEMADVSLRLANLDLSLARSMNKPDFSVGFMYNSIGISPMGDGMMTSGDDAYGVMFGVTLPIWAGKNRARINEAKANLAASEANLQKQTSSTIESIEKIYWRIQNQLRLVILYRDSLLPQARDAMKRSQTWYEAGAAPFSQLVEARLVAGNFEIATARAEADYLKAIAELIMITGTPMLREQSEIDETKSKEDHK